MPERLSRVCGKGACNAGKAVAGVRQGSLQYRKGCRGCAARNSAMPERLSRVCGREFCVPERLSRVCGREFCVPERLSRVCGKEFCVQGSAL